MAVAHNALPSLPLLLLVNLRARPREGGVREVPRPPVARGRLQFEFVPLDAFVEGFEGGFGDVVAVVDAAQ